MISATPLRPVRRLTSLSAWLSAVFLADALPAGAQPQPARAVPAEQAQASTAQMTGPDAQSGVMTRDALLASSREQYPEILAMLADRAVAAGKLRASQGAFDLFLESDAKGWFNGFYQGSATASVGLEQRFRDRGGALYGQYRISEGDLPVYEDVSFTDNLGEVKIGAVFALMRDRAIDGDRAIITDLSLAGQQAAIEAYLVQLGVQRRALIAYWNWLANGQVMDLYADMLRTAEARQAAFERQFEEGAIAEIVLVENRRVIASRTSQLALAEQNFQLAANNLSMFWRGPDGSLQTPPPGARPQPEPLSADDFSLGLARSALGEITNRRPDIEIIALGVDRARRQIALRINDVQPRVDVMVELSRDFGGIAEGGRSRDSTDLVAGVKFSVPLGQTRARGELSAARAELRARQLRRQLATEEAELEIRNILARLSASYRLYLLAEEEVALAEQMTRSEKQLFDNGASDLFRIIAREDDEARARIALISAHRNALIARTDYDAATVNDEALGLD